MKKTYKIEIILEDEYFDKEQPLSKQEIEDALLKDRPAGLSITVVEIIERFPDE